VLLIAAFIDDEVPLRLTSDIGFSGSNNSGEDALAPRDNDVTSLYVVADLTKVEILPMWW
jgi:hypothetical protein